MSRVDPTVEEVDAALADAVAKERELRVLSSYGARKITRRRAAALLAISERQVNRLMEAHKLDRVPGHRRTVDEQARAKREMRAAAARQVILGKITTAQAALRAGCSERTIYRYVEKLQT